MSDLVRVRLENGMETNVGRVLAEIDNLQILDEPTHRPDGTARPATRSGGRKQKPKTTVAKSAAAKKAVTASADDKKEQES